MSETDDTDVLLLIPPNFFLVYSSGSEDSFLESSRTVVHKPVSCTAQVIGKLVDQVQSLESRLESLELDTSNAFSSVGSAKRKVWDLESLDSRSLDRKCFTFPRRRRRKLRKERTKDVSLTSLDTVTTNNNNIYSLKYKTDLEYKRIEHLNDAQSMDGDISSIVSTPSKKNDRLLLHEIDEFLTKVESYDIPEPKKEQSVSPENVIKATGDYLSQKLETKNMDEVQLPSGRIVPSTVLDKYIYLVKNSGNQAVQSTSSNVRSDNDVTSYTAPSRAKQDTKSPSIRRLNFAESRDVQPTSTPKKNTQISSNYSDSFKPSSNKILDRASKVLEHYKSQSYSHNTQSSVTDASEVISLKREQFKMPQMRPFDLDNRNFKIDSIDTDLLSLSELWGEKGDRVEKVESIKLEEERLKREHCEAMIQQLQRKVLEQQEKIAVALKVDRAKDTAINKLREAWLRLTGSLDRAEERHRSALDKMVHEVENFKMVAGEAQKKTNQFETELYKALDLAHDYQDKCKKLTAEKNELQENMKKIIEDKDDAINSKEKEMVVLKENYETVMRLNKQSTDCVQNLEDALEKERSEHQSTKSKIIELNRKLEAMSDEKQLVQDERDILKDKVNEERSRCNLLERQLCDAQTQVGDLLKRCDTMDNEAKTLRKHLELQKTELKSHYQQQLEDAVLGKLQEFQRQLDLAEQDMELVARNKETAIVDTFNKQIVRIEEQHKLEINVLEEKQKEEIKLYRLQLAQANEQIGLLESRLESYRRRRARLAAQLHGVMQAQWRQALRLLTHGHARAVSVTSPVHAHTQAEHAHTDSLLDNVSDQELQQYVKMLLMKPPNFDTDSPPDPIDPKDLNEEPTSDRPDRQDRRDKVKRSLNACKPPWKA
ncbi:protein Daple [Nymphalis io]|uniref:protein Daple n=1 Tax=Inachis io TaxID=171585 RepID=UPI002169B0A9|nr:protein Daple [Nymphalis io]